ASRTWLAEFSLDPAKPLITGIGLEGRAIIRNASPQYWAATGKRRGPAGFDEFFDNPNTHPDGTRRFEGIFRPVSVKATTTGGRRTFATGPSPLNSMAAAWRSSRRPTLTSRHGITPRTWVMSGSTVGPAVPAPAPPVFWESAYAIPRTMAPANTIPGLMLHR